MTATNDGQTGGLLQAFVRRWRNWRAARANLDELASSGREAGNIAHDVGLSTADLYALSRASPDAAEQLKPRLKALGLDPAASSVGDSVVHDLERTCSLCGEKRRCERDLARAPTDPVWQTYCPNSGTLQALQEEKKRGG